MSRLPESLAVLRLRDFRLVFGAFAVSVLGDRMVTIALAFAVLELGGSATDVGIVLACRTLPLVGTLLIGGVVADRASRRAVMVAADLARLASQGALGVLLIAGDPPIWSLAVLSGLTGAATGFFNPAATGLLPAVVPPEHLQEANGLRAAAMSGGEIAGPALAGVLIATVGPGWALAIDGATFGVSALFLARLRLPDRIARAGTSFLHDLRVGWTAFWSRSWVWSIVLAASFGNLVWAAFSVLGPVVADADLGGAAVWGTVLAAMGAGALAGSVLAIRARPRRPLVLSLLVLTLFAVPPALLAAEAPTWLLAVGTFLAGGGMMLGISLYEATLQLRVPADVLSRVSSYDWFFSIALQPVGLAIWGPIAAGIGIEAALWLAAALLLTSILAPLAFREVRTMPGPLASPDP
jgi:predicted MFS family arabinose efflux permease